MCFLFPLGLSFVSRWTKVLIKGPGVLRQERLLIFVPRNHYREWYDIVGLHKVSRNCVQERLLHLFLPC